MRKGLKWAVIIGIGVGLYFLYAHGYLDYLNLENLKSQRQELFNTYQHNKFLFIIIFCGIYIVSTALSLPGATVLTLAGGACFGLWLGAT